MAIETFGGRDTPLLQCINPILDKWMVLWAAKPKADCYSFMSEVINHKPTIQEIKGIILNWYNGIIDNKIQSGFMWNGIPIWLSLENQFNYKAAYDVAVQSGGEVLPTLKFGTIDNPVYFKFESLEDLKDFYLKSTTYVSQTLSDGWKMKDTIDWSAYSDILNET